MLHEFAHTMTHIIAAGVILTMFWMRHQRKMAEITVDHHENRPPSDPQANAQAQEIARLRDRVRVLERIATDAARHDSSQSLAAQIDALKD